MQHSLICAKLLSTIYIDLLNYIVCSLYVGQLHFYYKGIIIRQLFLWFLITV